MSDCVVHLSFRPVVGPRSSGADQRTESQLAIPEPLIEYMSSATEERPKSARQGFPSLSIRMLCYKNKNRASVAIG